MNQTVKETTVGFCALTVVSSCFMVAYPVAIQSFPTVVSLQKQWQDVLLTDLRS